MFGKTHTLISLSLLSLHLFITKNLRSFLEGIALSLLKHIPYSFILPQYYDLCSLGMSTIDNLRGRFGFIELTEA